MRSLITLIALATAFSSTAFVNAESVLDYSKLPVCAKQCTVLAQAEGGCVPPAAPVTNQAIYQSCVCQSALITGLHSSGAQCEATGCSAEDAAKITTYYNALCNGPVVVPPASSTLATSTSTSTSDPTSTAAAGASTTIVKSNKWIDRTWRWLVFIIVVVVAMVLSLVLGIWWKRRHARKLDARKANVGADPGPVSTTNSRPGTGFLRRNNDSTTIVPTPPMSAMSTSNLSFAPTTRDLDGGISGIAPPRGPNKLRSRASTLQSVRLGSRNGSRSHLPEAVAWGPHQYAAQYKNGRTSVDSFVPPPSPTVGPGETGVFRNRQFGVSETRFQPVGPQRDWTPTVPDQDQEGEVERPRTAGHVDVHPEAEERVAMGEARTGSVVFVGGDGEREGMRAEVCEGSPGSSVGKEK